MFGETEITVKGIKFRQSSKIEVRFGDGKTAATVPGEFVDRTTVKCKTPNFETFGAIEVDVKVAISGEGWTVNTVKFQYFANTSAKNSIAFGPGLEPGHGIFGVEMPFLVLARDTTNMKRSSGGDKFVVNVKMDPNVDTRGAYDLGSSTSRIIDLNNGLYEVFYSVPVTGTYLVEVLYEELGESKTLTAVKGSPFTVQASSQHRHTCSPLYIPTPQSRALRLPCSSRDARASVCLCRQSSESRILLFPGGLYALL